MKKIIFLILIIFTLTACSATETPLPTPPSESGNYAPMPEDAGLTRGPVFLDSTDLLTLESFPLQFSLNFKGSLPTPCHQLRISGNQPDSQNQIHLDIYSVENPDTVCAEVLEPFEVNFPLGSFPSGHYTLFVNGTQITEFDA